MNSFRIEGDVLIITTKNGDTFLTDADEYEKLSCYSWCLSKTGYPVANISGKVTKMHRYILGIDDSDLFVDHKNHDKNDNRKANLRVCTAKENAWNKSGNTGRELPVGIRRTKSGRYLARIMINRREIRLGLYDTVEEAVSVRRAAEIQYFGDFAQHKYRKELHDGRQRAEFGNQKSGTGTVPETD